MTCKDCLHYDRCMEYLYIQFPNYKGRNVITEGVCKHFKNKSDFVEVKHGEWKKISIVSEEYGYGQVYYQHDDCKKTPTELYSCPYECCPRCGAKMDGKTEKTDI